MTQLHAVNLVGAADVHMYIPIYYIYNERKSFIHVLLAACNSIYIEVLTARVDAIFSGNDKNIV